MQTSRHHRFRRRHRHCHRTHRQHHHHQHHQHHHHCHRHVTMPSSSLPSWSSMAQIVVSLCHHSQHFSKCHNSLLRMIKRASARTAMCNVRNLWCYGFGARVNTEATGGPTLSFISTTTTGARKTCRRAEEKEKEKEKQKEKLEIV